MKVKIPAGIETGKSIRLAGKGMPGTGGGAAGDLLLKITVGEKPGWTRKGTDDLSPEAKQKLKEFEDICRRDGRFHAA